MVLVRQMQPQLWPRFINRFLHLAQSSGGLNSYGLCKRRMCARAHFFVLLVVILFDYVCLCFACERARKYFVRMLSKNISKSAFHVDQTCHCFLLSICLFQLQNNALGNSYKCAPFYFFHYFTLFVILTRIFIFWNYNK